ncbi:MAG: hypothetical protein J6J16_08425 [Lachnospiraceae bacterium]|nr:hypothetical protein [Lachnospiraceae bacterium]
MKKIMRKLFSFFVVFAMVLTVVETPNPVTKAADTPITEVDITVTIPLIGGSGTVDYVAEYTEYTVTARSKWNEFNQYEVDTIETLNDYGTYFDVTPKPGYTLTENTEVKINGSTENCLPLGGAESPASIIGFTCTPDTLGTIDTVDLTGMPEGNIGDRAEPYSETGTEYDVTGNWYMYDGTGYIPIDDTHTFADGNIYKIEYIVETKDGYAFNDSLISYVNGKEFYCNRIDYLNCSIEYYVSYAPFIDEVVIPEDKVPVATLGETFSDVDIPILETEQYVVYGRWMDDNGNVEGTFSDGCIYYLTLDIFPKVGYSFPQDAFVDVFIGGESYGGYPIDVTHIDVQLKYSFAEIIDKVTLFELPKASVGEPIDSGESDAWFEISVPQDAPYTAMAAWVLDDGNMNIATGKFENGKSYTLAVEVMSKNGYEFAENVIVNAYGVDEQLYGIDGQFMRYEKTFSFHEVIDKVEIISSADPEVGKEVSSVSFKVPDGANYYIDHAQWYDRTTHEPVTSFEDGRGYMVSMHIVPKEGYEFSQFADVYYDGVDCSQDAGIEKAYISLSEIYSFEDVLPDIKIDNIPVMKVGEKAKTDVSVPAGANYTAKAIWMVYNLKTSSYDEFSGVFETGKVYAVDVWVEAKDGFTFDEKTAVYINGNLEEDEVANGKYYLYQKEFQEGMKVIDKVEFTVTEPVAGNHSSISPTITVPANSNYKVDTYSVDWLQGDIDRYIYVHDYFVEGMDYGVRFWIMANDGYVFSEDMVIVVNGTVLDEEAYEIGSKDTLIEYFFKMACVHTYSSDADGTCDACGYVRFDSSPDTGDGFNLELMVMLMTICGVAMAHMYCIKRKEN